MTLEELNTAEQEQLENARRERETAQIIYFWQDEDERPLSRDVLYG